MTYVCADGAAAADLTDSSAELGPTRCGRCGRQLARHAQSSVALAGSLPASSLCISWLTALAPVVLRHPNGRSKPVLRLIDGDPPQLYVGLDETVCTSGSGKVMRDFAISTVRLAFFPGVRLAQRWLAAAFCGYLQHEALELVTVNGKAVLDPHADPYVSNAVNRGLRDGFPIELNYNTLHAALMLVMDHNEAERLIHEERGSDMDWFTGHEPDCKVFSMEQCSCPMGNL